MKPKFRLPCLFAGIVLAVSSPVALNAATIELDLSSNNSGAISLASGDNTFNFSSFGIDYLIVGGGGAGGTTSSGTPTDAGGGGGAGGLLTGTTNIDAAKTISVGAGGSVNTSNGGKGGDGGDSSAFDLTAIGGGGGGWASQAPGNGGSGGGAGSRGSADGGIAGLGTAGQGNDGGARGGTWGQGAASGGGAGGPGIDSINSADGRDGGPGVTSSITGVATTYAAGGGGGARDGTGGQSETGGNGGDSNQNGSNADDNTGGGGGGGSGNGRRNGGQGGSGIIVIRYEGPQVLTGGIVSTDDPDTVHQFLDTGTNTLGFNATIAGDISGAGNLVWDGGGTLALGGTNTYSGTTSVAFGNTLILNGDNSGATGAIDIAGTMAFGPSFDNTNIPATLNRVVTTSTGTIAVDNHAGFNFDFDTPGLTAAYLGAVEDSSYTGTLTPQGATYRLGGGGGTLTMANVNAITGANSLIVRENVILAENNDFSGSTTVAANASLSLLGSTGTSGLTMNADSTLTLGNNGSLGSGTLTIAGASTIQATGAVNVPNAISANANFTVAGTGSLTLGGTTTINANRTITNNNTTNPTVFADVSRDGSNNRNLAFSGNGDTIVNGTLILGSGTLTKNGNGTLTLNDSNTYTGTTTVNNGGTLLVNGDSSASTNTVTVNNTATLGGSGTLGGNVTITASANLAPGASVGTLSIGGDLTLTAMAGGAGKLYYELGPIAASDRIAVAGTLTIGTGTLGFGDFDFTDVGGLEEGDYILITSTTLDGTLDSNDLTGTINGFPAELQISGQNLVLVLGEGSPLSGYDLWADTNAPTGNPDDDFDGDGVPNAVEYVLGGTASTNDLDLLPAATTDSGNLLFTFVRDQDSITDTTVEIEVGTDLVDWPAIYNVAADTAGSTAGVTVSQNDPENGLDTVTLSVAQDPDAKKFARLKVTIAE